MEEGLKQAGQHLACYDGTGVHQFADTVEKVPGQSAVGGMKRQDDGVEVGRRGVRRIWGYRWGVDAGIEAAEDLGRGREDYAVVEMKMEVEGPCDRDEVVEDDVDHADSVVAVVEK